MRTRTIYLAVVVGCLGLRAAEASADTAMRVATGQYHTCALTTGGGVLCAGDNFQGQLGDGTTTQRLTPTGVSGLDSGVVAIEAGGGHTCVLTAGGAVLCWGDNDAGKLGDGTTTQRLTPTGVSGLGSGVAAIEAGGAHTCAVTTGGAVRCWGSNSNGQLGDGTTTDRWTPTALSGPPIDVEAIAAGGSHTCAVTTGGAVLCWGSNSAGQLGDGTTTERRTPTPIVELGSDVVAVTAGGVHTCALTTDGGVLCWGANNWGQLGDGTTDSRSTPAAVTGLESGVTAIAAGYIHTCALTAGGGAVCWGSNYYGQLGDGTTTDRLTPTAVRGLETGVTAIASVVFHTCAVRAGGALVCWGSNSAGQLGNGTTTQRTVPTAAIGLGGVAGYSDFTADLKSDILWRHTTLGEIWLWWLDHLYRVSEARVRTVADTDWEIRGVGDHTGDGKVDILWRNRITGMVYVWLMDGFTPLDEVWVATVDPAYDIVGTGDFDGDGKSDILWRHTTLGDVWIWRMHGATRVSEVFVGSVDPSYTIRGIGNFDGDTKADLVWQHATTGEVWVWLMDGPVATQVAYVATVGDLDYRIAGVADYTGDGKADLLWHHATRGELWLWRMAGATKVSESYVATVPETAYQIVGTGDYDGNGTADFLWHHATRGEVWVWLMDGAVKVSEHYVGAVPDMGYRIVR